MKDLRRLIRWDVGAQSLEICQVGWDSEQPGLVEGVLTYCGWALLQNKNGRRKI